MNGRTAIFTKKMANYLCQKGFKIVEIGINNQKPWLYVYYFDRTDELAAAICKYKEEIKHEQ